MYVWYFLPVLADGNFPSASIAKHGPELVPADGHGNVEILDAVLSVLPLDKSVASPVRYLKSNEAWYTCYEAWYTCYEAWYTCNKAWYTCVRPSAHFYFLMYCNGIGYVCVCAYVCVCVISLLYCIPLAAVGNMNGTSA